MNSQRQPLVAGNWKMNGDQALLEAFSAYFSSKMEYACEVVLCPPAVYLAKAQDVLGETGLQLSAQTVSHLEDGAHTGDMSVRMLREFECRYCIIGHSERRTDHGETNHDVALKAKALLEQGLTPLFCVGEPLEVRDAGEEQAFVGLQLKALFETLSVEQLEQVVIAYEPIWAIGTGVTASPQQAQDMHAYIRAMLAEQSESAAHATRILYGGSVKGSNAKELFAQQDIDGGLIGGASLKPQEFESICLATGE
jgi:triosephosphate isomerase